MQRNGANMDFQQYIQFSHTWNNESWWINHSRPLINALKDDPSRVCVQQMSSRLFRICRICISPLAWFLNPWDICFIDPLRHNEFFFLNHLQIENVKYLNQILCSRCRFPLLSQWALHVIPLIRPTLAPYKTGFRAELNCENMHFCCRGSNSWIKHGCS